LVDLFEYMMMHGLTTNKSLYYVLAVSNSSGTNPLLKTCRHNLSQIS